MMGSGTKRKPGIKISDPNRSSDDVRRWILGACFVFYLCWCGCNARTMQKSVLACRPTRIRPVMLMIMASPRCLRPAETSDHGNKAFVVVAHHHHERCSCRPYYVIEDRRLLVLFLWLGELPAALLLVLAIHNIRSTAATASNLLQERRSARSSDE